MFGNPRSVAIGGGFGAIVGGNPIVGAFAAGIGEILASQILVDGRGITEFSFTEAVIDGTISTIVPAGGRRFTRALPDDAGFPNAPTKSPGVQYTLPDGWKVRLMGPTSYAPRRASFTNANNGPINPFTGKPVQPPPPPGMTMREWMCAVSHVEQAP